MSVDAQNEPGEIEPRFENDAPPVEPAAAFDRLDDGDGGNGERERPATSGWDDELPSWYSIEDTPTAAGPVEVIEPDEVSAPSGWSNEWSDDDWATDSWSSPVAQAPAAEDAVEAELRGWNRRAPQGSRRSELPQIGRAEIYDALPYAETPVPETPVPETPEVSAFAPAPTEAAADGRKRLWGSKAKEPKAKELKAKEPKARTPKSAPVETNPEVEAPMASPVEDPLVESPSAEVEAPQVDAPPVADADAVGAKATKPPKTPKEPKAKTPKPPKEPKAKEAKPPKRPREPKAKDPKAPKRPTRPMHSTPGSTSPKGRKPVRVVALVAALVALVAVASFAWWPKDDETDQTADPTTTRAGVSTTVATQGIGAATSTIVEPTSFDTAAGSDGWFNVTSTDGAITFESPADLSLRGASESGPVNLVGTAADGSTVEVLRAPVSEGLSRDPAQILGLVGLLQRYPEMQMSKPALSGSTTTMEGGGPVGDQVVEASVKATPRFVCMLTLAAPSTADPAATEAAWKRIRDSFRVS